MTDIRDSLAQVVALCARTTEGPWECGNGSQYEKATNVYSDDDLGSIVATCAHSHTALVSPSQEVANAQAIAAAVNFLREHGPALLAVVEGREDG